MFIQAVGPRLRFWHKIGIGMIFVFIVILVIVTLPLVCCIYRIFTESALLVRNYSGEDVRFEQVMVDSRIIWRGPIVVKTYLNLKKPYLDTRGGHIMPHFHAPRKIIELTLVTINDQQEREAVSCVLDNRARPCIFDVEYFKGKLKCGKCCDYMD